MQTNLYYRAGDSDKVYQVAIEKFADGYRVSASWGRRGSTLQTAVKTPGPVILAEARRVQAKLVAAKVSKGYSPDEAGIPYRATGNEGRDSGIRCQLLNSIEDQELERLLSDDVHVLQEKFDGKRLLIRKEGEEITGINRRGLCVALPEPMIHAAQALPFDFIIDGEAIGEKLHVFDLLECRGRDLRALSYWERLTELMRLFEPGGALQPVATAVTSEDKRTLLAEVRKRNAEGVVFKDRRAPFQPGRPASAGSQLKFKFVTTASFIVAAINSKRSVALELMNGEQTCPAGNVTIPAGEEIPTPGEIVEVRYLYAFRESGRIYQPVYLGKRDDLVASDCSTDQLKFAPSKAA